MRSSTTANSSSMVHENVQSLNYCAHAIEDFKKEIAFHQNFAPNSGGTLETVSLMLTQSVKFILPNRASLLAPESFQQAYMDLVRLPFPCVAFEYPYTEEPGAGAPPPLGRFEQRNAIKRIALCWDTTFPGIHSPRLNAEVLKEYPEGGIFVLPLSWFREVGSWRCEMGGSFIPYNNTLLESHAAQATMNSSSRLAHSMQKELGIIKPGNKSFTGIPFIVLREEAQRLMSQGATMDEIYALIQSNSLDEVMATIQACCVMNCKNSSYATLPAPPKLNKKRKAEGKPPFFSYKVLTLQEEKGTRVPNEVAGTHASPRMHIRRAHIRRIKDSHGETRAILVRHTIVMPNSERGIVLKDYRLPPRNK